MERYVYLFKRHVINFKLTLCCFMLPVKSGLLAFACIHVAIGVSTLMFFAEESFEPLLLKVLNGIADNPPNYGPSCMIVYAVELGSNVVLLCGIIRNDLVLLRVYMYFALGVLTAALMAYSVMFVPQELTVKFLIAASIGHQFYILLLLRSSMIEIKQTLKQNDYSVRYRKSSVKYIPGTRDRYSVVIEPYRRRSSGIPYGREPYRRSSSLVPLEVRQPYRRSCSLEPYVREDPDSRRGSVISPAVQEKAKPLEMAKEERTKVTLQSLKRDVVKEETAKVTLQSPKEDVVKEEMTKVKEREVKAKEGKSKRSIFGRKEKMKKDKGLNVTNDA